jgi:hypothetical protein
MSAAGISVAEAATVTASYVAYPNCSDPSNAGCVALSSYLTGPSAGGTINTVSFSNASNSGFTSGIATYSGSIGLNNGTEPLGDSATFAGVGAGIYSGSEQYDTYSMTISFSAALTYFGLYWGTPSGFDTLALYNAGTQIFSYSGSSLSTDSFVSFNAAAGTTFNKVVLTSAQCCFENANNTYVTAPVTATPEPRTLSTAGSVLIVLPVYAFWRRRRARTCAA